LSATQDYPVFSERAGHRNRFRGRLVRPGTVPASATRLRSRIHQTQQFRAAIPHWSATIPVAYLPGGRFTATNATLVDVIVQVYQTRRIQMEGGPGWIDSDRFDIVAKADASEGEVKDEQWPQMIQALLEDRFKLKYHRETKEMPVLALVGRPPAAFHESKDEESTFGRDDRGQFVIRRMPVSVVVNLASNILRPSVIDGTGIEGLYDFVIDPTQSDAASSDGTPGAAPTRADRFVTALREQFGFKLEKRKAPL
jgi:uncharacterized protein (TIGR03435 family)